MDDQLNPRPEQDRRRPANERWREMQRGNYSSIGAVVALVGALLIGLLLWSMWSSNDPTDTRVGQNVERTTPDAPRNPNTTPNTNK